MAENTHVDLPARMYRGELERKRADVDRCAAGVARLLTEVQQMLDVGTAPEPGAQRRLAAEAAELAQLGHALHALDQFAFMAESREGGRP